MSTTPPQTNGDTDHEEPEEEPTDQPPNAQQRSQMLDSWGCRKEIDGNTCQAGNELEREICSNCDQERGSGDEALDTDGRWIGTYTNSSHDDIDWDNADPTLF